MISVIIPIYNEEENIDSLYQRLNGVLKGTGDTYEILLVDDGSTDRSVELIKNYIKDDDNLKLLRLSRNFGHQAAISAGISVAKGNKVVIMDGDLQDPPEVIPKFISKLDSGYDVVYAIRKGRKEKLFKKVAYAVFYRLLRLISEIDIPLDSGDFCIMNEKVLNALKKDLPEHIRFVRGLRAYVGFKQMGLEYSRDSRYAGKPKYTLSKLLKLAVDGLFDFSRLPLRLASYFGFMVAFTSFIIGVFFVFHRIFDFKIFGYSPIDNPGLATTVVGMFFLGGITLIVLGIIGEYIGRIYIEVKKRPSYLISNIITKDQYSE